MNPLLSADAGAEDLLSRADAVPHVRFGAAEKLIILGCLSALAYASVALYFWTDAGFKRDPQSIAVKLLGIGIPSILYFLGVRFVKRSSLPVIVGFGVLFASLSSVTLPFDSTDAAYYIAAGWHQSHYGENPYTSVMREIPGLDSDKVINNRWMEANKNPWKDSPFPYGFGFAILTRTIAWLGAGNWWAMLALLDGVNLLVHLCMSVLLWKTVRFVPGADPRLVLYLYAWNPMVLMQSLANAHNDILMAFGILAAAYFVLRGDAKWSIPLLVVAGLIKYGALVLLPFAVLAAWRSQGRKATLKASALGGLLGILAMIPYWPSGVGFKLELWLLQSTESGGSLHAFAATLFRLAPSLRFAGPALQILLTLGFLCFLIHQFMRSVRIQLSVVSMIQMWTTLLFVAICIVSPQFYAWYLVILVPTAVLGAGAFVSRAVLTLTATHVLAFADLRRKSIGYFAICTLLPMAVLYWSHRKGEIRGQTP